MTTLTGDWMGQGFITSNLDPARMARYQNAGKTLICAHAGCQTILHVTSTSGVCRAHRHVDECLCKQCWARGQEAEA